MFDNFSIGYDDSIFLTDLVQLGLTQQEIEQVFYSEYHVVYPLNATQYYLIGYTGRIMLVIDFLMNFSENRLIITDLRYATGQNIDDLYCPARR